MRSSKIRWAGGVAAALMAAGTVGVWGVTTAGAASTSDTSSLHLTSRLTTSVLFIPCPACVKQSTPPGAHIGGTQIDAGDLFDAHGHKVGHYGLDSVAITPFTRQSEGELMLTATLVIGNDQIVAQGIEEPPLVHGTIAVTGGTGHFRSAHGQVTFTDQPDGSTSLRVSVNG